MDRLDDPEKMAVFERCKDDIQYTARVSMKSLCWRVIK
jgi:hypothetical protein